VAAVISILQRGVFYLLLVQLGVTLGSLWIIRALHDRQPYLLGRRDS